MATAKKTTPTNVRSAHLSGIAKQHSEGVSKNEQQALMEGYWGRIAENQRVSSLRVAWQDLWTKAGRYLSKEDIKHVGEAFVFAAESHKDQRRYSGDPYVVHTVSVAAILTEMELDSETIVAALLHDVLEDTEVTDEVLKERVRRRSSRVGRRESQSWESFPSNRQKSISPKTSEKCLSSWRKT
ncbi:MAG: HD domain-containing protein [Synergistaceae bacterium]